MPRIVLIDNRDSFVYNLVDAVLTSGTAGARDLTVFRNSVPVDTVLASDPDLILLSPGPSRPSEAGNMPALIAECAGRIPLLGICLGFQALVEHFGGTVEPCGPEHGTSIPMTLTDVGAEHPIFEGLAMDLDPTNPAHSGRSVPVARYHSLGCTSVPEPLRALATTPTSIGSVVMAAESADGLVLGLQFHPESILTPAGPIMLRRCIDRLFHVKHGESPTATTVERTRQ